ncbi:hypothetical protein EY688_10505 [Enterococcus casseliflavus]|uniref:hypothetical protein n=1 Tax=Enterococcus casseliflavus TaxID=37734 RepID=UPI001AD62ABC|nr:hypothetical protein [Enterococcus casseliflavus]MBO6349595.1 hypothetical protein [Enterococcus casseliflavus]MBO6368905.1 hypothetical protein [Enterococcus casseliflavus]
MKYSTEDYKEIMIKEFSDQVNTLIDSLMNTERRTLKKQIFEKEREYLENNDKATLRVLMLGQIVYKQRFKRELILKGKKYDY